MLKKKPILLLILCQCLIIMLALGSYIINRGNAFSQTYYPDNFSLTTGKIDGDLAVIEAGDGAETFLQLTESLDKGIYLVRINYHATSPGNTVSVSSTDVNELELRSNPLTLDPAMQTAALTLDLRRAAENVTVSVHFSGIGTLSVSEMGIHETSNLYKRNILYSLGACLLLGFAYFFWQADLGKRRTIFILSAIFGFSCIPLMTDYMMVGHDLPFHLLRIEGIYHGILQGSFPVKIHPVWAQDYGYAVGIFYGDAFLYLPAFLRIMGLSVQEAYKVFAAAINLGTVLITYYCFRRIFQSSYTGLLASALYTLSIYRLSDVYTRASIGEYLAMMFLPMVLCGFYLVFTTKDPKEHRLPYAALIAFGLTGIVQSHILSCEMLILFVVLLCLILLRKILKFQTFITLALAAGLTLFMNLGFLVPFLSYFDSIHINSAEWGDHIAYSIQNKGMFPVQLFSLMQRSGGGTWSTAAGIHNEAAYPLGLVLTLCTGLFLYILLCCKKERENKEKDPKRQAAVICCILGGLAAFMSTCYFPWDTLAASGQLFHKLIVSLEFPWRFLAFSTILLVFPACYALHHADQYFSFQKATAIFTVFLSLLFVSCGWYYYDFTNTTTPYRVYDTYELDTMSMYSYDYLPMDTNPDEIRSGTIYTVGEVTLSAYEKNGTTIKAVVSTGSEGGYLEFPLNYYRDYIGYDLDTQESLSVEAGYNNMVRLNLPGSYSGHIQICFREPIVWRIAEIVSLLTFGVVAILMCRKKLSGFLKILKRSQK